MIGWFTIECFWDQWVRAWVILTCRWLAPIAAIKWTRPLPTSEVSPDLQEVKETEDSDGDAWVPWMHQRGLSVDAWMMLSECISEVFVHGLYNAASKWRGMLEICNGDQDAIACLAAQLGGARQNKESVQSAASRCDTTLRATGTLCKRLNSFSKWFSRAWNIQRLKLDDNQCWPLWLPRKIPDPQSGAFGEMTDLTFGEYLVNMLD